MIRIIVMCIAGGLTHWLVIAKFVPIWVHTAGLLPWVAHLISQNTKLKIIDETLPPDDTELVSLGSKPKRARAQHPQMMFFLTLSYFTGIAISAGAQPLLNHYHTIYEIGF